MKKQRVQKNKSYSYTARLLLIFLFAGLIFSVIWMGIQLYKVNVENQEDITAIREALEELEGYAKTAELDEQGKPYIHIELEQPAIDMENMGDILSIVQNQYEQASQNMSNQITIFSIIITIVVLAIPIFNYRFLQKDQVERLNKQYEDFSEQIENKLERQNKAIAQFSKVTEAVANPKEASPDIKPISDSNEDRASAYYMQSGISLSKNEDNKALSFINKALELEPKNAKYYYSRGILLHTLKRDEEALEDANKSIELEPDNKEYHKHKGQLLKIMKRDGEA